MKDPCTGKEIWFLMGSQDPHGFERLEPVAMQSKVAAVLAGADGIPPCGTV